MGPQPPPNRRPTPTHLRSQAAAWNSVRQRATVGLLYQRRHAAAQAQGAQGARRLPCIPTVQPRVDTGKRLLWDAARGPHKAARQGCRLWRSIQLLLLLLLLLLLQVLLLLEGGGGEAGGARRRRSRACGEGGGGRGSGALQAPPSSTIGGWMLPEQARRRKGAGCGWRGGAKRVEGLKSPRSTRGARPQAREPAPNSNCARCRPAAHPARPVRAAPGCPAVAVARAGAGGRR